MGVRGKFFRIRAGFNKNPMAIVIVLSMPVATAKIFGIENFKYLRREIIFQLIIIAALAISNPFYLQYQLDPLHQRPITTVAAP